MRNLDLWYSRIDVDRSARHGQAGGEREGRQGARSAFEANVAKGRTKDSMKAFGKLTTIVDGEPRIIGDPPLIVPIEDVAGEQTHRLEEFLRERRSASYRRTLAGDRRKLLERFRYVHAARKVVGVGSVGTRAWICLMLGRDGEDPLFLQFKEAQPSVLEPFLGRSEFANSGQRVVEGQRLTQAASDIMLGWIKIEASTASSATSTSASSGTRRCRRWSSSWSRAAMRRYARVCGTELARAHARAGDGIAIASYLGDGDTFDRAMATSPSRTPTRTSATTRR